MSLRETVLAAESPDARRLRLHIPDGTPPCSGWPLLVLLDGDWIWPLDPPPAGGAGCAVLIPGHGGLRGLALARFAAQDAAAPNRLRIQALARRALDFTPPAPDGGRWPDPRRPEWQCGGADAFLDALLGPMLAWAHDQAPLDPNRLCLYGHSYGGLCALYALVRHPGRCAHTVCASPSLWWQDGRIEALLDGLPRTLPARPGNADAATAAPSSPPSDPVRLTLLASTQERWYTHPLDPAHPRQAADGIPTLPRLTALRDRLADIPWLACTLERLDGLQHGDALRAGAQRALALAAT
ncbi:MAG: alpha/beta hydrolase-fold protein [Castellaniella sp.]|uniref:alpha/beta hydrolase n=1 Tax=Castellaniella sp. TaxID=1955812 RepID=UPI002A35CB8C|nr:alpha/beta fold hydrolase [Castellaniella sp.]MDY0309091.1 alpha/beta hydrolase-fold protein [Castellaniella sp.]